MNEWMRVWMHDKWVSERMYELVNEWIDKYIQIVLF